MNSKLVGGNRNIINPIGCNNLPGNSFGSVGCNIGNAVTGTIMGVGNMFGAISDTISLGTMNF